MARVLKIFAFFDVVFDMACKYWMSACENMLHLI